MKLVPLGEMNLTYVGQSLDFVDYGVGGQYYAGLEGEWRSHRISGRLRLTNIAQKRSDNVNTPTLRGILETPDGATLFVEMNGLSQIEAGGRVFVSTLTLRTAHPAYAWTNTLFAVVEGELHGRHRPNEFGARCLVHACQPTISPNTQGGPQMNRVIAFALPVLPGKEHDLQSLTRELESKSGEFEALARRTGVTREAAFLQRTPQGSQLLVYREREAAPPAASGSDGSFERWLSERLTAVIGFDPAAAPARVELLVHERPARRGRLYAAALPLRPDRTARVHEFASELNGIHAAEFQESLRRLGFGLALFVQHLPQVDLVVTVVEGEEPESALGRLAMSAHPFDRWHLQQIADQTGLDLSGPPPPPNERLWAFEPMPTPVGSSEPSVTKP